MQASFHWPCVVMVEYASDYAWIQPSCFSPFACTSPFANRGTLGTLAFEWLAYPRSVVARMVRAGMFVGWPSHVALDLFFHRRLSFLHVGSHPWSLLVFLTFDGMAFHWIQDKTEEDHLPLSFSLPLMRWVPINRDPSPFTQSRIEPGPSVLSHGAWTWRKRSFRSTCGATSTSHVTVRLHVFQERQGARRHTRLRRGGGTKQAIGYTQRREKEPAEASRGRTRHQVGHDIPNVDWDDNHGCTWKAKRNVAKQSCIETTVVWWDASRIRPLVLGGSDLDRNAAHERESQSGEDQPWIPPSCTRSPCK